MRDHPQWTPFQRSFNAFLDEIDPLDKIPRNICFTVADGIFWPMELFTKETIPVSLMVNNE